MRKKIKKMPDGGKVNPLQSQLDFYNQYLHSPNYLKRLKGMGYTNPEEVIRARSNRISKTKLRTGLDEGSAYYEDTNTIVFDPHQAKHYPGMNRNVVLAHEMSHGAGSFGEYYAKKHGFGNLTLNKNEINALNSRNKLYNTDPFTNHTTDEAGEIIHDAMSNELKADIDAFRYKLKTDKLYDTGTQEFNQNILNKAKKLYSKDPNFQRTFKRLDDKDLIWLMNNIAANQPQDTNTAKNGHTMRVKAKNLLFSSLPSVKELRGIMAEQGATAGPGPDPRIRNFIKSIPDNYFDMFGQPQHAKLPGLAPIDKGPINTSNAIPPSQPLTNPGYYPRPQMQQKKFNAGDAMLLGLTTLDMAIPHEPIHNQQVIRPQEGYQPYPRGTGSQALMDDGGYMMNLDRSTPMIIPEGFGGDGTPSANLGAGIPYGRTLQYESINDTNMEKAKSGNWIQKAVNPKHKGFCTPMSKKTCTPRRKALARTFKKHHGFHKKEDGGYLEELMAFGGIIPDNMSNFTQYANGGSSRGRSDTFNLLEQVVMHPNQADMMGWARDGGTARGGSDTLNIFEQIVMHPNMADMQGWDKAKKGKTLTRAKAREILHDGTAQGHKLTDKQRRYFGAVASGYAAAGAGSVGGEGPGSGFTAQNMIGARSSGIQDAQFIDTLNYSLVSGNRPKGDVSGYTPDQLSLLTGALAYRQQHPGVAPEQVIQGYYNRPVTAGNTADAYRQRLSKIGYGPTSMYYSSPNQDIQMRQGAAPPQYTDATRNVNRPTPTLQFDSGGIMYADGGEVETLWGGGVGQLSDNPYDGGTLQFNGDSHEEGGIGMHYNGNPVEVEGGETASRDSQGNLNIFGNMYLPGTKTKFKTVAKEIAEKEKRYDRLKTRGSELVNNSNPANKFEQLSFNAGRAMMAGGSIGQQDLAEKKENLAHLQRAMLDTADQFGLDAQHMSKGKIKKAKGGTYIPFAADGLTTSGDPNDPKRSDRNHNPGNIRWSKFAREHGAIGRDKDGFAIFPDRTTGLSAMTNLLGSDKYKNLTVKQAIKKWTGGKPYKYDLGALDNMKVSELQAGDFDKVVNTMVQGEGTRYGGPGPRPKVPSPPTPYTPYGPPDISLTPDQPRPIPGTVTPPPLGEINVPRRPVLPSNTEPLNIGEVAGELYAAATNKVEPVPMQEYNPQLYQPYQVSFQDRLNQNQSSFNALQRTLGVTNPSALGALAAQKYAADSSVKADEFRTNQAIAQDITNKNIGLMNDAKLKNLGLADTQMVRQSTARSKTAQLNQMIVNSISSKYLQNRLENKRLAAYENLYDYRFVPTDQGGQQATYFGPAATFNFNQTPATQRNAQDVRTVSRYDAQGNLKSYMQYDDSQLEEAKKAMDLEYQRRKLPLLTAPPLQ